jgi:Bacterial pullanase-associated domain/Alpha amylase, C-terminal all-beta domain
LKRYAAVYQGHPALRVGAQIHRYSTDGPGIYAFSRLDRDEKVEYLVALNNSPSVQSAEVPTFYPGGTRFRSLSVSADSAAKQLVTDAKGQLTVEVPALGLVIYQASEPVPASQQAPEIRLVQPESGQTLVAELSKIDGQPFLTPLEIRAELSRDIPAEVTFSVQVNGGPYQILGTDDNPPYRVYYRPYDTPEDAKVSFLAVVNDLSGHLAAATVANVSVTRQQAKVEQLYDEVVIHYIRSDRDYGDPSSSDYNDLWGLHLWGEALATGEETEWTKPRAFDQTDACGRYTVVALADDTQPINFIVHRGDRKDGTDQDRSFSARNDAPEIWLIQDKAEVLTEPPDDCPRVLKPVEQVAIHYRRSDGDYGDQSSSDYHDLWGLHLWGDALAAGVATEWTQPRPFDQADACGRYTVFALQDDNSPVNFIVHRGDGKDGTDQDRSFEPRQGAEIWLEQGSAEIHTDPPDDCPRALAKE